MSGEVVIISESVKVHADNVSINKRTRDARRLLANPAASSVSISSGEITLTPKSGEGGGLWAITESTDDTVVHTINGLSHGDVIALRFDGSADRLYIGEDGSSGNCLFAPQLLQDDGKLLWVECDENGDIRLHNHPSVKERKLSITTASTDNVYSGEVLVIDFEAVSPPASDNTVSVQNPIGDGTYSEFIEIIIEDGKPAEALKISFSGSVNQTSGLDFYLGDVPSRLKLKSNDGGTGWLVVEKNFDLVDVDSITSTKTLYIKTYDIFEFTLAGNVTLTFHGSGGMNAGKGFTLIAKQDGTGSRVITWPSSVDWVGGTAPTQSSGANDVDIYVFFTIDGGTTFFGFQAGKDMS
jgi:hypothetical protein